MYHSEAHLSDLPYFPKTRLLIATAGKADGLYTVNIHADLVKIRANNSPPPHSKHERGEVTGFSNRSRKRMLETLASISEVPDIFCTLTWSDDVATLNREHFKRHFEVFRKWLEYHYDGIKAIWRVEIEERKSGDLIGSPLPHMHLLIWLPPMSKEERDLLLEDKGAVWRKRWHEILQSQNDFHLSDYGLQIETIKSRRHSYYYASKYVGKHKEDNFAVGRRWGRIGELDTLPRYSIELSRQEFIELKRLIISYARRVQTRADYKTGETRTFRSHKVANKFAKTHVRKGLACFGLGVDNDLFDSLNGSTIQRMIIHAIKLAKQKEK